MFTDTNDPYGKIIANECDVGITDKKEVDVKAKQAEYATKPSYYTLYIHPLYTFITMFTPMYEYTLYTCIVLYTIFTPNTPLNTLCIRSIYAYNNLLNRYCSIIVNDQVLSTPPDAFPTNARLQSALSWLITTTSGTGMYAKAKKEAMATFVDSLPDACGAGITEVPLQRSNIEGTTNQ